MRKILSFGRWLVIPVLLLLGAVTGGADGFVGWFILAWMLYRAAPGMWRDIKGGSAWLRGLRLARFARRSAGGGLNV